MKKFVLAAAILAVSATTAVAESTDFAPKAGDFSTEIQFNPFSNDFGTFKLDQLKGRYFFGDKDAIRFGIGFGFDSKKNTPKPDSDTENWSKGSTGFFSIDLGYERHFFNYKRIDLYAGAGLGYQHDFASSTSKIANEDLVGEVKYHNVCGDDRTANRFNLKAFTGIDFYVYKGLYVGAEFGLKFSYANQPGTWSETTTGIGGNVNTEETEKTDKNTLVSFKTFCEPSLRLGWTF